VRTGRGFFPTVCGKNLTHLLFPLPERGGSCFVFSRFWPSARWPSLSAGSHGKLAPTCGRRIDRESKRPRNFSSQSRGGEPWKRASFCSRLACFRHSGCFGWSIATCGDSTSSSLRRPGDDATGPGRRVRRGGVECSHGRTCGPGRAVDGGIYSPSLTETSVRLRPSLPFFSYLIGRSTNHG